MIATDHLDGPISWRQAGSGQPVVFLHGLGGTRMAWEPQLEQLSARMSCIAWDLPGYGGSAPLPSLSFRSAAAAVVSLLDTLAVERADLVGLSMGGQIAQYVAIHHGDRVRRLVLADTSHRFGADGTDPEHWKRLRLDALDAGLTPADIAAKVIDSIVAPGFGGVERGRQIAAFAMIESDALRAAVEMLPSHDTTQQLRTIGAPTLVIVGEHDVETPRQYADQLATAIPGAELVVIPDAGHLPPAENPAAFNAAVLRFLT